MAETKMYRVMATMSTDLCCHVNMPAHWDKDECWVYAKDYLDGDLFLEDKNTGDWNTYDCQELDDSETKAVQEVVAHGGDAVIVDAEPTTFDKDPRHADCRMDDEFEDDDKWCIKFRIMVGDQEFFEYSWITHKFNRTATNEDLIKEVYGIEELDPIGKEGEQPYWMDNRDHGVEVYHREPLNDGEYNALKLMGVLY